MVKAASYKICPEEVATDIVVTKVCENPRCIKPSIFVSIALFAHNCRQADHSKLGSYESQSLGSYFLMRDLQDTHKKISA